MLKKITKLCLATAAFALIAGQASAAEVTADVTGWVFGNYSSHSVKTNKDADTITKQKFYNKGRLGTMVTTTEGDWKAGGKFEFELPDDTSSVVHRDKFAFVEYKNIFVGIGRQWYGGVTQVQGYYLDEFAITQFVVGENCTYDSDDNFCRTDSLVVDFKDYGFSFRLGQDYYKAGTGSEEYQETLLNAIYAKSFGAADVAVEYNMSNTTVDDKASPTLKDGEYDGAKMSSLAAGVTYKINDKMAVKGNFETTDKKSGASGADTLNTRIMMAAFDFGIDETMGVSASYGVDKTEVSDSDDTTTSIAVVSFEKAIAGAQFYAQYATKNVDSDLDSGSDAVDGGKETEIAVGLFYAF